MLLSWTSPSYPKVGSPFPILGSQQKFPQCALFPYELRYRRERVDATTTHHSPTLYTRLSKSLGPQCFHVKASLCLSSPSIYSVHLIPYISKSGLALHIHRPLNLLGNSLLNLDID